MAAPFPFSAIVGQEEMKQALLLAAIDPSLGGVLVFGDRGSGKSTAVRALAALLPPLRVVPGCPYRCDPVGNQKYCVEGCEARTALGQGKGKYAPIPIVDLPLGATEDRVVGALDIEKALTQGEKAFEPGLLARANRGFLYIDEVNLLEDHLVDLLLDVAASGENVVEREGLSIRHPARFVLVGSGNPEEGELRPQLLDRFGLSVEVSTPKEIKTRIEVIKRRDTYERDRDAYLEQWADEEEKIRKKVASARNRLDKVELSDALLEQIAGFCAHIGSDGLRGELTLMRASRALAALEGKKSVSLKHVRQIAPSSLRHRLRRDPLDETGATVRIDRALDEMLPA